MSIPDYIKDPKLNLYVRTDFPGVDYSQAVKVERRLLSAVEVANDRSVFSRDLARAITDWPSEHHFSPWRHCLLRPLDIKPGQRVLEMGCGCGAITRFLGEIGASVTAIESDPMRARIASTRCQDLPNVRVFAEQLGMFELDEQFDWVILVGVLEDASTFSSAPDGVRHFLERLSRSIGKDGRLVLAVENKLGLKQFSGCAEDPLETFSGIREPYSARRRWGRKELRDLLVSAGFNHTNFLYPFPDFKMPRAILTEAAMADPQFAPQELLANACAREFSSVRQRMCDELLVAREFARNGLMNEMSNSFLVVAAQQTKTLADSNLLAVVYTADCAAAFTHQTRIVRRDKEIRVVREHLYPDLPHSFRLREFNLRQVANENGYITGTITAWPFVEMLASRRGLDEIVASLLPWFEFLLSQANGSGSDLAHYTMDKCGIGLTPFDVVETPDGLKPVGEEWVIDHAVPLGWVASRCIALITSDRSGFQTRSSFATIILEALCMKKGIRFSTLDLENWFELENEYQDAVWGMKRRNPASLQSDWLAPLLNRLDATLEEQSKMLADRDARIGQLTAALSVLEVEKSAAEDAAREKRTEAVGEIVALTRLVRENEDTSDWLHKVAATLVGDSRRGRLARLLPGPLLSALQNAQLKRRNLFDAAAYLRANPDVARAGAGALRHYILFGLKEGRRRH